MWNDTGREAERAPPSKANAMCPLMCQLSPMHLQGTFNLGDTKMSLKDILEIVFPGFVHVLDVCPREGQA